MYYLSYSRILFSCMNINLLMLWVGCCHVHLYFVVSTTFFYLEYIQGYQIVLGFIWYDSDTEHPAIPQYIVLSATQPCFFCPILLKRAWMCSCSTRTSDARLLHTTPQLVAATIRVDHYSLLIVFRSLFFWQFKSLLHVWALWSITAYFLLDDYD